MKMRAAIVGNSRVHKLRPSPLGFEVCEVTTREGKVVCIWGVDEDGWEHVSVSPSGSKAEKDQPCPTWSQMHDVKRVFWDDSEMAVQLHPPEGDFFHGPGFDTNILHLWRPADGDWSRLDEKES